MLETIDLRTLAEQTGPERAFVSLYLSGPEAVGQIPNREERVRRFLADSPVESEHFAETMKLVHAALEEDGGPKGPMAIFASWAAGSLVRYPLPEVPEDLLWVDSSPYIRPLARLQQDYEGFVLVFADNEAAEVHVVSASRELLQAGGKIRGDIKNHVKKGGWSQKRYQRRRQNELLQYAKEVAERLGQVVAESGLDKIVLVGSQESLRAIGEALPQPLAALVVGSFAEDLDKETEALVETAAEAAQEGQREEVEALWHRLRNDGVKEGLAVFGPSEVLAAALEGRLDVLLVHRGAHVTGMRCRDCEQLADAEQPQCPACGSTSVFSVDLLNELVKLAATTGATSRSIETNDALLELGGVAATLRWASEPAAPLLHRA
jgi:peptide subunit release factor 1 (eRF1)